MFSGLFAVTLNLTGTAWNDGAHNGYNIAGRDFCLPTLQHATQDNVNITALLSGPLEHQG